LQLHPIRSTDDLLNFIYSVYVYPASTPRRAHRRRHAAGLDGAGDHAPAPGRARANPVVVLPTTRGCIPRAGCFAASSTVSRAAPSARGTTCRTRGAARDAHSRRPAAGIRRRHGPPQALDTALVFENILLYRLDRQMVHSHSGLETFCTEWVSLWNEPAHVVDTIRKTLAHCWQARSWLLWLDEIAAAASEPQPKPYKCRLHLRRTTRWTTRYI